MKTFALANKNKSIFCKISQDNGATWIQGIIVEFSDVNNTLNIFLSSKNFHKYFNNKNKLVIKSLNNKNENIYIGSIDKNPISSKPRFIKVNIEKTLSFYDNRSYIRFLVNYTATIVDANSNSFRTKLSDLSFNGLSFFSNNKLKTHSKISITINVSYNTKIHLQGTIVGKEYIDNEIRYSVSTKPVTPSDHDTISQVMNNLLLAQNGIQNKYVAHSRLKKLFACCLAFSGFVLALCLLYFFYAH